MPESLPYERPKSFWYLVDGEGLWQSRWEATHHDLVLMLVTVMGASWLIWSLVVHSQTLKQAQELSAGRELADHLRRLRYHFLAVAALQVLNGLLIWLIPTYFAIAASFWVSAMTARALLKTPAEVLAGSGHGAHTVTLRLVEEQTSGSETSVAESASERHSTVACSAEGTQGLRRLARELRQAAGGEG